MSNISSGVRDILQGVLVALADALDQKFSPEDAAGMSEEYLIACIANESARLISGYSELKEEVCGRRYEILALRDECRKHEDIISERDAYLADLTEIGRMIGCDHLEDGLARCVRDALDGRDDERARKETMLKPIEDYLVVLGDGVRRWYDDYKQDVDAAAGSSHNHQAWPGGYRHHLAYCLDVVDHLYHYLAAKYGRLPFALESAYKVIFFHDVEKVFKYGSGPGGGPPASWDKHDYLFNHLMRDYGISFTTEEQNAIRYIHGEGEEYDKRRRVMNELCGLCHAADVVSARVLHDRRGDQT